MPMKLGMRLPTCWSRAGPAGLTAALNGRARWGTRYLVEQDLLLGGSLLLEEATGTCRGMRQHIEMEIKSLPCRIMRPHDSKRIV